MLKRDPGLQGFVQMFRGDGFRCLGLRLRDLWVEIDEWGMVSRNKGEVIIEGALNFGV